MTEKVLRTLTSKAIRMAASLFFLTSAGQAQIHLDFSGYVVDLPIFQSTSELLSQAMETDQNQLLNLTRARFRPTVSLSPNARISLEYELTVLYHSTARPFAGISDVMNRQTLDLRWDPVRQDHLTVSHFVDRLYLRQNFDLGNIIIGRQRIAWGTGRVWNPTDLFNPINPATFDKIEKDGADAVSVKLYLGSFTDLHVVYNSQSSFDEHNLGVRFRTNAAEYDWSAVLGYFDKRYIIGGDFAGNLFDAGVRGEGILSIDEQEVEPNFGKFIRGLDNQFTSRLYALIEYQFNGEGRTDQSSYDLSRLVAGEILNLSKSYVFVQASYLLHPLLTASLSLNANLNDGSGFVGGLASYSMTENLYVHVGGLVFYGGRFDEYWYYPDSAYLKGEWYF
ncbi:MAG: hypothetical protein V3U10_03560 [Bacteroidota bacterium]